uniref:Uncharacterized protein n=1 Tax=Ditylenchus dipsaci TaxID=166011 RepID=A0A915DW39_9BILA
MSEIFSSESSISFARWGEHYLDYAEVFGQKWEESEKINHIKFLLRGLPRKYFDKIPANQKDTAANVIRYLSEKLDGTRSREVALQELLACRQRDQEDANQFAGRVIPIVETIMQGRDEVALNDTTFG